MCFYPPCTEWKTWNENVIKSYANKKCCSWLQKKETVISNTILYLISILTDRISRDEIYLRKVSLPRVTGERISMLLQLLHPGAFLFLTLVQRKLFCGIWRLCCLGGVVFPSSLVQGVARCLSVAQGTGQPAVCSNARVGLGRLLWVGCRGGQPGDTVPPNLGCYPGALAAVTWLRALVEF